MKTVTMFGIWLLSTALLLTACREDPAEPDPLTYPTRNTIIGQLYHSNQVDALFQILPAFQESTQVGSPAWIEMENVLPYACVAKSGRFTHTDTTNRRIWRERADSAWAAIAARRGLGRDQEFARMQLWQTMNHWRQIVRFVESHPEHQSMPHSMDLYYLAKLESGDTVNFLENLQVEALNEWDVPWLILRYHEVTGHDSTARAMYEQSLADQPNDAFLATRYAKFLIKQGEYDQALALVERARELSRGLPGYGCTLYALRGQIQYLRGEYEAARADSAMFAYADSVRVNVPAGTRLH